MSVFAALAGAVLFCCCSTFAVDAVKGDVTPMQSLAQRVAPRFADQLVFETLSSADKKDRFELECIDGKLVIRGNNGVAQAVGLNWFLKYHCLTSVSWYADDPIELPEKMPQFDGIIRQECSVETRFFLNYCTFGYTMPWWQWEEWERLIDWMALNGVTMPLAITGQEAIWQKVWMDMGLSDEEVRGYFSGPAHLPWHRMGNIDSWDGPLPQSYIDHQLALQKSILARERELGMTPVLPGFAGHVPEQLKRLQPEAKITHLNVRCWGGFKPEFASHFLDPEDPLFHSVQKAFLEEQTRQFGTDHIYGVDPFNEMTPPSLEPEYLSRVSKSIYHSLAVVDPDAIWLQMSWLFHHKAKMWTPERVEALVSAAPRGKMMLLDYYCENVELWRKTSSFYGQPYIWCFLGNFGGNTVFAGDFETVNKRMNATLSDPDARDVRGVGSTLEAMGINPVMHEFVLEKVWRSKPVTINEWIKAYARRRCGSTDPAIEKAWSVMANKVYRGRTSYGLGTLLRACPALKANSSVFVRTNHKYNNKELFAVWNSMLKAKPCDHDAYRFDLVNVASQALENDLLPLHATMIKAWKSGDAAAFERVSARLLEQMADIDRLCATRNERLLGKWIAEARAFASNEEEARLYEKNARTILTTWGTVNLVDYANRAWAGLIDGYYLQRWKLFVSALRSSIDDQESFDEKAFTEQMRVFEVDWTTITEAYPSAPVGDSLTFARELYQKYGDR